MDSRKLILKETAIVAAGQAILCGVMLGVLVLLGERSPADCLGAALGWLLAVLNFFFMALGAMMAADKAEAQDPKGGERLVRLSFLIRYAALIVLLFALVKSGLCSPIPLVLPQLFTRLILSLEAFFRKAGDNGK